MTSGGSPTTTTGNYTLTTSGAITPPMLVPVDDLEFVDSDKSSTGRAVCTLRTEQAPCVQKTTVVGECTYLLTEIGDEEADDKEPQEPIDEKIPELEGRWASIVFVKEIGALRYLYMAIGDAVWRGHHYGSTKVALFRLAVDYDELNERIIGILGLEYVMSLTGANSYFYGIRPGLHIENEDTIFRRMVCLVHSGELNYGNPSVFLYNIDTDFMTATDITSQFNIGDNFVLGNWDGRLITGYGNSCCVGGSAPVEPIVFAGGKPYCYSPIQSGVQCVVDWKINDNKSWYGWQHEFPKADAEMRDSQYCPPGTGSSFKVSTFQNLINLIGQQWINQTEWVGCSDVRYWRVALIPRSADSMSFIPKRSAYSFGTIIDNSSVNNVVWADGASGVYVGSNGVSRQYYNHYKYGEVWAKTYGITVTRGQVIVGDARYGSYAKYKSSYASGFEKGTIGTGLFVKNKLEDINVINTAWYGRSGRVYGSAEIVGRFVYLEQTRELIDTVSGDIEVQGLKQFSTIHEKSFITVSCEKQLDQDPYISPLSLQVRALK